MPATPLAMERFDPTRGPEPGAEEGPSDNETRARTRSLVAQGHGTLIRANIRKVQSDKGQRVREFTLALPVLLGDLTIPDAVGFQTRLQRLLDEHLNRGYALPRSNEQLHVWVALTPVTGHGEAISLTADHTPERADQLHLDLNHSDEELLHELLHYLGNRDTYHDQRSLYRRSTGSPAVHTDGLMAEPHSHTLATGLLRRDLARIEDVSDAGPHIPDGFRPGSEPVDAGDHAGHPAFLTGDLRLLPETALAIVTDPDTQPAHPASQAPTSQSREPAWWGRAGRPSQPGPGDGNYYTLGEGPSHHLYRLPPPGRMHPAFAAHDLPEMVKLNDHSFTGFLVKALEKLSHNSKVSVTDPRLTDERIRELLTQSKLTEYPEIESYLNRRDKRINFDTNTHYRYWRSSNIAGAAFSVNYDPTVAQSSMNALIGHTQRSISAIRAAGFAVPKFDLYVPKYTRSLKIGLSTNALTAAEELAVTVEKDPEFGFLAKFYNPSAIVLGSELAAPERMDRKVNPNVAYGISDLLEERAVATIVHEVGHLLHHQQNPLTFIDLWNTALRDPDVRNLILNVSRYAFSGSTIQEFIAEYFLGYVFEKTYADRTVADRLQKLYLDLGGPTPRFSRTDFPVPPLDNGDGSRLTFLTEAVNTVLSQQSAAGVDEQAVAAAHARLSRYERRLALNERAAPIAIILQNASDTPAAGLSSTGPIVMRMATYSHLEIRGLQTALQALEGEFTSAFLRRPFHPKTKNLATKIRVLRSQLDTWTTPGRTGPDPLPANPSVDQRLTTGNTSGPARDTGLDAADPGPTAPRPRTPQTMPAQEEQDQPSNLGTGTSRASAPHRLEALAYFDDPRPTERADPHPATADDEAATPLGDLSRARPDMWLRSAADVPTAALSMERFDPGKPGTGKASSETDPHKRMLELLAEGRDTLIRANVRKVQADNGQWVREFTLALPVLHGDLPLSDVADFQARLQDLLDTRVNLGYPLPRSKEQLHVWVVLAPFHQHGEGIRLVRSDGSEAADQTHFDLNHSDEELLHELLHYLGLADEYQQEDSLYRHSPDSPATRAGKGPMAARGRGGPAISVLNRHLALIEDVSGSGPVIPDRRSPERERSGSEPTRHASFLTDALSLLPASALTVVTAPETELRRSTSQAPQPAHPAWWGLNSTPTQPGPDDGHYYTVDENLTRHIYRLPPPNTDDERYQQYVARNLQRLAEIQIGNAKDRARDSLASIAQHSGVFINRDHGLTDDRLHELMAGQRNEYPEIDTYLARNNKSSSSDANTALRSFSLTQTTVGGTRISISYDPTVSQPWIDEKIRWATRAVTMVQSAGFRIPNFNLWFPKYTRSLKVRLETDPQTGRATPRVTMERPPRFNSYARTIDSSIVIVGSEINARQAIHRTQGSNYFAAQLFEEMEVAIIVHELGHLLHRYYSRLTAVDLWNVALRDKTAYTRIQSVSSYAALGDTLFEFVAEYFTGLVFGRTYSDPLLAEYLQTLYQDLRGPIPTLPRSDNQFPEIRLRIPGPGETADPRLTFLVERVNAELRRHGVRRVADARVIQSVHNLLDPYTRRLRLTARVDPIADLLRRPAALSARLAASNSGTVPSNGGRRTDTTGSGPLIMRMVSYDRAEVRGIQAALKALEGEFIPAYLWRPLHPRTQDLVKKMAVLRQKLSSWTTPDRTTPELAPPTPIQTPDLPATSGRPVDPSTAAFANATWHESSHSNSAYCVQVTIVDAAPLR